MKYRIYKKLLCVAVVLLTVLIVLILFKFCTGYNYVFDSNMNVTLTQKYSREEIVEVPSKILFFNVKKLGSHENGTSLWGSSMQGIFDCDNTIEELIISEGIEEIEGGAITNCDNLRRLQLPSTIKRISVSSCPKLKDVCFSNEDSIIEYFCFNDCQDLEYVKLPHCITGISNNAFARCFLLQTVVIPDTVTGIGDMAFQSCSSLKEIDLPDDLESLGAAAFQWCVSLETIDIPSKIKIIEAHTFTECESLEKVNLPGNLISINDGAFKDCISLERINIYDKCSYIADNAFEGCDKLTIYGIKGSYAEKYANAHNIPFEELK